MRSQTFCHEPKHRTVDCAGITENYLAKEGFLGSSLIGHHAWCQVYRLAEPNHAAAMPCMFGHISGFVSGLVAQR